MQKIATMAICMIQSGLFLQQVSSNNHRPGGINFTISHIKELGNDFLGIPDPFFGKENILCISGKLPKQIDTHIESLRFQKCWTTVRTAYDRPFDGNLSHHIIVRSITNSPHYTNQNFSSQAISNRNLCGRSLSSLSNATLHPVYG
jgi:hypothetical protein